MTYKLARKNHVGLQKVVTRTNPDGNKTYIPFDPANTDYQEYLKWVDEGNTAEAAD